VEVGGCGCKVVGGYARVWTWVGVDGCKNVGERLRVHSGEGKGGGGGSDADAWASVDMQI
jgi:hypothetical protein